MNTRPDDRSILLLLLHPGNTMASDRELAMLATSWLANPANCKTLLRGRWTTPAPGEPVAGEDGAGRVALMMMEGSAVAPADLYAVLSDYDALLGLCLLLHPENAEELLVLDEQLRSNPIAPMSPARRSIWRSRAVAVAAALVVAASVIVAVILSNSPAVNQPLANRDNQGPHRPPSNANNSPDNRHVVPVNEPRFELVALSDTQLEYAAPVVTVAWSPDREWLVAGARSGRVYVFAARPDGSLVRQPIPDAARQGGAVRALAVVPLPVEIRDRDQWQVSTGGAADYVVVTAGNKWVHFWRAFRTPAGGLSIDVPHLRMNVEVPGGATADIVRHVRAFNNRLSVGLADGRAVIVPLDSLAELDVQTEALGIRIETPVERVSFSPDGELLALSSDRTVVIPADRFDRLNSLRPDERRAVDLWRAEFITSATADPRLIGTVSAASDAPIAICRLAATGDPVTEWTWDPDLDGDCQFVFTADGRRVAATNGATVHVCVRGDDDTQSTIEWTDPQGATIESIGFSPAGDRVVAGLSGGRIVVLGISTR